MQIFNIYQTVFMLEPLAFLYSSLSMVLVVLREKLSSLEFNRSLTPDWGYV